MTLNPRTRNMVPTADYLDLAFNAQGKSICIVECVMISELESPPPKDARSFVVLDPAPFALRVERSLLVSMYVAAENAIHAMDPTQPRNTDIYHGKLALLSNHAYMRQL